MNSFSLLNDLIFPGAIIIAQILAVLMPVLISVAFLVYAERKVLAQETNSCLVYNLMVGGLPQLLLYIAINLRIGYSVIPQSKKVFQHHLSDGVQTANSVSPSRKT